MSSAFGSTNLFGAGASSNSSSTSYAPSMGLRQRHTSSGSGNVSGATGDENDNPNNSHDIPTYGKWGSMSKVRAPPRMSLATAGKSTFQNNRRDAAAAAAATQQQQQQVLMAENNSGPNVKSHQQAIVRVNENREEDLSLWVVGYGYRNETHFRALYSRLESCGTITARRGGLSCYGEGKVDADENADADHNNGNNNWVAVRYESALCAQKALCHRGKFVDVGGSTIVLGVMPLKGSDAAAKLGINVNESYLNNETVTLSRSYNNNGKHGELRTETDILLEGERGYGIIDDGEKSGMDSLCGRVLSWFFMWENTQV